MDTNHYKTLLIKECSRLEEELKTIGRKTDKKDDWEAVEPESASDMAEEGDVAEVISEYENNSAILGELELQLKDVKAAIEKIDAGTYGTCEVCGATIEEDRLEANPAAKTCKTHMGQ